MSARVVFIGERILATGFALSGAQVMTPAPREAEVWNAMELACESADLVLISGSFAQLLGDRLVRHLQRKPIPPVLRVPEAKGQRAPVQETLKFARASLGLS